MTKKITEIEVIFRHDKKDENSLNGAFDILFEEVYRLMNEKPIVAEK